MVDVGMRVIDCRFRVSFMLKMVVLSLPVLYLKWVAFLSFRVVFSIIGLTDFVR